MPEQVYYFSPTAKAGLRLQAFRAGYVTSLSLRNYRGLSSYLDAVAKCELQDTRPDEVREYHNEQLAALVFPSWTAEEYRPQNRLNLNTMTIARLYKYGIDNDIINPRHVAYNPSPQSVLGVVIEAIGISWVTPIDLPHKATHRTKVMA